MAGHDDRYAAATLFEGEASDVGISPVAVQSGDRRWVFVNRSKTFWTNEYHLVGPNGRLVPVPLPADAEFEDVIGDRLVAKLQSPLAIIETLGTFASRIKSPGSAPSAVFSSPGLFNALQS